MGWFKALIVLLFGLSFTFCSYVPRRKYYYISSPKTWKDAQLYCRENHTDLATYESMEDLNQLTPPEQVAWIGLHDDPAAWKGTLGNESNSWKWSTTGQPITSQYHHWIDGQTTYVYADKVCVIMDGMDGKWTNLQCDEMRPFVCYTDVGQNQKTYEFISTNETWSDAQTYCRQNYTDLAAVTNSEEDTRVHSLIPASPGSWIGLSRVSWVWSDKNPSTFRYWSTSQPSYGYNEQYVTQTANKRWGDTRWPKLLHFICYQVVKSKSRIMMQMKTTADLTDPAVAQGILQKINATFHDQRLTDQKLRWTRPGKPQEKLP